MSNSNTLTNKFINNYENGTKGILIEATSKFRQTTSPVIEEIEIATFEAKEYPITVNVPIQVDKGEKISIKAIKENIGTTTTALTSNRIRPTEKEPATVPKEDLLKMEKKVEELNAIINTLTGIIEEKASYEGDSLSAGGGFMGMNSTLINKIGSFLLLFIAVFVSYCLSKNTMFSPIGGTIIVIISIVFSVLFWVYSVKIKESRC